jgi:nucleoside-diphosphate-sugar epimerase
VYGPRDNLFLPNLLEASGTGRLRIFGNGQNRICFTHVDNYAHGLIIAERALYKGSVANGKFYVVTDGDTHPHPQGYASLWGALDEAGLAMGFDSLWGKMKLPLPLLIVLAYIAEFVGYMLGTTLKLNRFNVKVRPARPQRERYFERSPPHAPSYLSPRARAEPEVLTPHCSLHGPVRPRFPRPIRAQVLTMHRWFVIDAAKKDLKYEPIVPYSEGWPDTLEW